jgi:farnesyl-diphosphate farnesyltransferase
MTDLAQDRRYSRDVLPRVSRTFALNIRMLPGSLRDAVENAYLLCRTADALEDSWPGQPGAIRARFERFRAAIDGDGAAAEGLARDAASLEGGAEDLELVRHFPAVWRVFRALDPADRGAIADAVRVMAEGMSRYASRAAERDPAHAYLEDEAELDDYCWVVAGCVGVMLTRLQTLRESPRGAAGSGENSGGAAGGASPAAAADARRLELAPLVGRALQLTNILLDWPQDVRRGRCYVPNRWLAEHGIAPAQLVGAPSAAVSDLSLRLEARARAALARVPDYLELVPGSARRYRLFVLLPALWALRSLERARRDPEFPWGNRRPKLTRAEIWSTGAAALLVQAPLEELRGCVGAAPGRA